MTATGRTIESDQSPAASTPTEVTGDPAHPTDAIPSPLRRRLMVLAVLVLFAVIHSCFVWPGRMSDDTFAQMEAVRSGRYTDWHAPLLVMLWRPFWRLGVGPGWVTAASTLTYLLGLYGILRSMLGRRTALKAVFVTTLFPPVLGYVGYLGRDLWYVAFFFLALACMARLAGTAPLRWRRALLGAVFASLWLMGAARQNALPVAGVMLLGLLSSCGPWPALGRFDRATGSAGTTMGGRTVRVGIAAVALLCLVGAQMSVRRAFDVKGAHPEQALHLYDVAGVSVRVQENLFSPAVLPSQDLSSIEKNWSPKWVNSLLFTEEPTFPFPLSDSATRALRQDWMDTIRSHPVDYLKVRWVLWERQMALHTPAWWVYQPGISSNRWGYETANPTLDAPLQQFLQAGVVDDVNGGGNLYKPWFYLAVTMAGLFHLRQRETARQLLGWGCLASLAYQGTVFFGAMGADYRMVYPSVVLAVVLIVVGFVDLQAHWRARAV